jgi:pSer/pThr/pTyr-binding forkhead associated (FHA) protein
LHSFDILSGRIKRKPVMFKLELALQNLVLKEYTLSDRAKLTIGRLSQNDIVLKDMSVSRRHATIEVKGQKLLVSDSGSKNGTMVNGTKAKSAELYHGDVVQIGKNCSIKVSVPPPKKKESTITGEHDQETSTLKTSGS